MFLKGGTSLEEEIYRRSTQSYSGSYGPSCDERSELQLGKKVLATIFDVCPLVALLLGRK